MTLAAPVMGYGGADSGTLETEITFNNSTSLQKFMKSSMLNYLLKAFSTGFLMTSIANLNNYYSPMMVFAKAILTKFYG